jgi:class 3 adenylate cyclase
VARRVLDQSGWNLPAWLPEQAVEAFIAADDIDSAVSMIDRAGPALHGDGNPGLLDRARGRLALARDDPDHALALLRSATTALSAAGARLEVWRTLLLVVRAHAALGERAAAQRVVEQVVEEARSGGADLLVSSATHLAAELGLPALPEAPSEDRVALADQVSVDAAMPTERMVTVMFADIRDYTAMAAANAPAELTDRVATFHRWAAREVDRHRGIVDKFAGDAVMATFNVSEPKLDHCTEALGAAIALQDRSALVGLQIGVGIAVGPAVVGQLTRDANLSVLGETTNLASRLQAQAGVGEILLSDEAFRRAQSWLAERRVDVEHLSIELKGIPTAVLAHRVCVRHGQGMAGHPSAGPSQRARF